MAIINQTRKFVFVHVPKAAGTSVTKALSKYTEYSDLEIGGTHFGELIQPAYKKRFGLSKHSPASKIKNLIGGDLWKEMFTFSIVRDPYSRVISTFKFLQQWEGTPKDYRLKISKFKDVNDFILSDMLEQGYGPDLIFKPQAYWLTDESDRSKVLVDFVGKLESLDRDISNIVNRIEGKEVVMEIPRLNTTEGNFNLLPRAVDKINNLYARDFKFWGYDKR